MTQDKVDMDLNEEEFAFGQAVMYAFASWANVEASMYLVASYCFPKSHRHILGMGFTGIEGFRSKKQFTDRAVTRKYVGTRHIKDWEKLCDELGTQSEIRNKLAHNKTRVFPTNTEGRRWAICPWTMPKGTNKTKPPPKSYCLIDIFKFSNEFYALHVRLNNFAARIARKKAPFLKVDERPLHPPTIRQIANQIHARLGHPQLSSRERQRLENERDVAASLKIPIGGKDE